MIGSISHNSVSLSQRRSQAGFTLIELVVVIVILGILAASAAPRFMSIQSDARIATLQGFSAAAKSGNIMIHSKALITGIENYDNNGGNYNGDCDGTVNNCIKYNFPNPFEYTQKTLKPRQYATLSYRGILKFYFSYSTFSPFYKALSLRHRKF